MSQHRRWAAVAAAVLALAVGAGAWTVAAGPGAPSHRVSEEVLPVPEEPGSDTTLGLDTSFFLPAQGDGPFPAVLIAHGFGGSKDSSAAQAEQLAAAGYAVLTWSARGFGASQGRIGLNDPDHEVADVSHLIDWLAERPEVGLDGDGDPRVGMTGSSYGGAVTLMAAGHDHRIDAITPQATYHDLGDAFFPESTGAGARQGVFKRMWTSLMFTWGGFGDFGGLAEPGAEAPDEEDADGAPDAAPQDPGEPDPGGEGAQESADPLTPSQQELAELARRLGLDTADLADPGSSDALGETIRCGFYREEICRLYEEVAETGRPTEDIVELLHRNSPASVVDRVEAPTLLVHGMRDSLFTLDQADANARALRGNDVPLDVVWVEGGHDGGDHEGGYVRERIREWFDAWLKEDRPPAESPGFTVSRPAGVSGAGRQDAVQHAEAESYTGLDGTEQEAVELSGSLQPVTVPPGGSPASVSSLPGLSGLTGLSELAGRSGFAIDMPGQVATFESAPLPSDLQVTGAPTVEVDVTGRGEAILFAKVYDVDHDGRATLPQQLVAPVRVRASPEGTTARIRLPAVDHRFAEGHTLRFTVSTSDMAFSSPVDTATYGISLAGERTLTMPLRPELSAAPVRLPEWTWALPLTAVTVAAALLLVGRRAARPGRPDPDLADVPLHVDGLTKRYANDHLAVDDLSFRVERGQVLGLLGPNGAGKTTALRVLLGLVRPDAGGIRVFGHPVVPGAPVLSRLGALVEGPGGLPHLSGRANLELYWRATGRPLAEARIDEAVRIADLGTALEHPVRTYSQGMRQRLAIAQAMLGLPDLLVLDEPTNGLDPPQIREMRDVLVGYAATGRTVVISSHLLAEVEQTCTHVVVMDRGRRVAAGPVGAIVGEDTAILVGTPDPAAALDRVRAVTGVSAAEATDEGLLVHLDGIAVGDLVAELVGRGVRVDRVVPRRRLEDAFLSLIAGAEEGDRP
ncbi:hypothetical protein GCM10022205_03850 [Spinactinospora alkalitolerans]